MAITSFKGTYERTIDAKGRMFLPTKYREALGEMPVVCMGFTAPCLFVYSQDEFERLNGELESQSMFDESAMLIEREVYGSADDIPMDKQGRILIPASLREFAGFDKDVLVKGARKRVEIWNKQTWEEQQATMQQKREAMETLRRREKE